MPAEAQCPYLVHVTTDWLFVYPLGAFCRHPDGHIRVPCAMSLATRCVGDAFRQCEGYARFAGKGEDNGC